MLSLVASSSGGAGPSVDEAAPMFRSRALLSFTAFEPFGVLLRSVVSRHVAPTSAENISERVFYNKLFSLREEYTH